MAGNRSQALRRRFLDCFFAGFQAIRSGQQQVYEFVVLLYSIFWALKPAEAEVQGSAP